MSKNPKDKSKSDKARHSGPKHKPKKQSKREVFVGPGPVAGVSAWVQGPSADELGTSVDEPAADEPAADEPGTSLETTALGERLSANVRALRKARGLSLEALSRASGVSRAALSQIETGKSNPSVGAVWKIATGLGVPFGDLIGEDRCRAEVLHGARVPRRRSSDGAFESRPLVRAGSFAPAEACALTLAPGGHHAAGAHAAGTRELLVVVEGRMAVSVARRRFELAAGDSIVFSADVPHAYANPGKAVAIAHSVLLYAR